MTHHTASLSVPDLTGIRLADRVSALKPSVTVAVTNRAKELRRNGADVLGFAAGEPDFDTPDRIKQAAVDALWAGQTKYMPTLGDPDTRRVVAEKLTHENGIPGLTGNHIAIGAGGKHILYTLCHCLFDKPNSSNAPDEAVLPVPAWVSYDPIIKLAGGTVVPVDTSPESGFLMTPEQLDAAITPRTRAVFLNSPSNPCGTMYSPDQIRALAAVIARRADSDAPDLVVVTDEIYEKIVYGGIEHLSIGSVPEVAGRTITINGLSKAFAMTGWRVGYAGCPGEFGATLIKAMATLQGQMTTNITSFVYPAIRVALTECGEEVDRMRRVFGERAELVTRLLGSMHGLKCPTPTGAFYAFPDISAYFGKVTPDGRSITDSLSFCEALLDEAEVALVPGDDFGGCGPKHVRISFACSEEQIERGMDRLGQWLSGLR